MGIALRKTEADLLYCYIYIAASTVTKNDT